MKTRIKSVTIVNQQGTRFYQVGSTCNGLKIDKIMDASREYPYATEFIYEGITKDGELVFGAVNCSVDIQYEPIPVENPCPKCSEEWDQSGNEPCPHCGNLSPF